RLLDRPVALARGLLATFAIMPVVVVVVALLTPLRGRLVAGLLLVPICPPGLGLSQQSLKQTGDSEIGLAWQTLAIPISVVTIPLSLLAIQNVFGLSLDLGIPEVLEQVGSLFLIPITTGFLTRVVAPGAANVLLRFAKPI